MYNNKKALKLTYLSACLAGVFMAPVSAQDQPNDANAENGVETVTVLGSRQAY